MLCQLTVIQSLLQNRVFINRAPQINGKEITITEQKDIEDPSTKILIIKNNISKIIFKGDNITSILSISGLPMITNVDIEAKNVYTIPNDCFENCIHLETVKLSSNIKTIGQSAFKNSGLKDINLESVEVVGVEAFSSCSRLTKINLAAAVNISEYAFSESGVESFTFNDKVIEVAMSAFQDCLSLTSVKLGSKITKIKSYAFSGCLSLKNFDKGGASIDTIDSNAFEYTGLKEFIIDATITTLGGYAFYQSKLEKLTFAERSAELLIPEYICKNCIYLKSIIIPENVKFNSHGSNIFGSCVSLESIKLPLEVKVIPKATFSNCSNLVKVEGSGIEEIGAYAFYCCIKLSSFPFDHVSKIKEYSFSFCSSLKDISKLSTTTHIAFGSNSFSYCTSLKIEKLYSKYTLEQYAFLGCSKIESITISCQNLAEGSFAGCLGLKAVSFDSISLLQEIGPYCFMNCTNLKTIQFTDNINIIGYNAFEGCHLPDNFDLNKINTIYKHAFAKCQMKSLTINTNIYFDEKCFIECNKLEKIIIGQNVDQFSLYPFFNCSNLASFVCENNENMVYNDGILMSKDKSTLIAFPPATNIEEYTIPNDVTQIYQHAFAFSTKLKKINLNHYIEVSNYAFYFGYSLVKFILETNAQISFGSFTFYNCISLKSIKFLSPVYSLGIFCFAGCVKLKEIDLSSCSLIGEYCFFGCIKLKEINLSKVEIIPYYAFQSCCELSSVVLSEQLVSIGESAFASAGLKSITIPNSCKKVDSYAFHSCKDLSSCEFSSSVTKINSKILYNTSISHFKIYDSVISIETDAFQYSNNLKIEIVNPQTNKFMVDGQALIYKPTKKLVLTFGKLPQEYKIPSSVEVIGKLSINSNAIKDEELEYPTELGTTTVIIPSSVKSVELRAFENCQYLYNLCYEGDVFQTSSVNAKQIFVTDKYPYLLAFQKNIIRTDCNNKIPDSYNLIQALKNMKILVAVLITIAVLAIIGCIILGIVLCVSKKKGGKSDSDNDIEPDNA